MNLYFFIFISSSISFFIFVYYKLREINTRLIILDSRHKALEYFVRNYHNQDFEKIKKSYERGFGDLPSTTYQDVVKFSQEYELKLPIDSINN